MPVQRPLDARDARGAGHPLDLELDPLCHREKCRGRSLRPYASECVQLVKVPRRAPDAGSRTSEFYDLFAQAGANALEAARMAETRFREYPNSSVAQADVKAIENEGDRITRDIIQLLNTQYVTPFDREDIYELATAIDDVVDLIEEATRPARALRGRVDDEARARAVPHPRRGGRAPRHARSAASRAVSGVQASLVEVKRFEDEGDRVVREAIAALFQDSRIDPLLVIRWKDIFDALERRARRLRDGGATCSGTSS